MTTAGVVLVVDSEIAATLAASPASLDARAAGSGIVTRLAVPWVALATNLLRRRFCSVRVDAQPTT